LFVKIFGFLWRSPAGEGEITAYGVPRGNGLCRGSIEKRLTMGEENGGTISKPVPDLREEIEAQGSRNAGPLEHPGKKETHQLAEAAYCWGGRGVREAKETFRRTKPGGLVCKKVRREAQRRRRWEREEGERRKC